MKRLKKAFFLFLFAFMLTGCMKMDMTIDVDNRGKVKTSVQVLASEELIKASNTTESEFVSSLKKQFTASNKDVSAQKIERTDNKVRYVGIEATNGLSSSIKSEIKGDKVTINIPMSTFSNTLKDSKITKETIASYKLSYKELEAKGTECKLVFNMPDTATSNIGKTEGKKVTIDLLEELMKDSDKQVKTITVSSSIKKPVDIKTIGLIAFGVILVAGVLIYNIGTTKQKKKKEMAK